MNLPALSSSLLPALCQADQKVSIFGHGLWRRPGQDRNEQEYPSVSSRTCPPPCKSSVCYWFQGQKGHSCSDDTVPGKHSRICHYTVLSPTNFIQFTQSPSQVEHSTDDIAILQLLDISMDSVAFFILYLLPLSLFLQSLQILWRTACPFCVGRAQGKIMEDLCGLAEIVFCVARVPALLGA